MAEAQRVLRGVLAEVDDEQVRAPSLLPGWSRGHVLAHLTDNARMFARLAEHALCGERVPTYDGGQAERDAIIEDTAGRTAAEHRAALAEHTEALMSVWSGATAEDWQRPVSFRNADIAATVFARWREVWIHLVDLDLGVRPAAWPEGLAGHALDFLLSRLPDGTCLVATDLDRRWPTGTAASAPVREVRGEVRDLAAWLAGRTPGTPPTPSDGLPELGPWPPHPPHPPQPTRPSQPTGPPHPPHPSRRPGSGG
ncbi:maleylpyruvate isomerase family mycothiol-dependent enzyme [Streptomyces spirodelae]|uniref:maleylpyruvate isomerase family mycothiol-dependent enzyme n=1 Tax=Streptomyces spirodelae TaxID=2812904 RepID=UPI0027DB5A0F|nr:maleylpyruvate isomerase family mycothiol-dependent enzyme [Streptomyces spirodelae]